MNKNSSALDTSVSKRLLSALFAIALAMNVSGCSSSGNSEDGSASGDETFAEESSGDFQDSGDVAEGDDEADGAEGDTDDTEVVEGDDSGKGAAEESEVAEGEDLEGGDLDSELAGSDDSQDPALDDGGTSVAGTDDDELSLDDEQGLPDDVAGSAVSGETEVLGEDSGSPPTDAPVFADQPASPGTEALPPAEDVPRVYAPLLKVKSAAFEVAGANLNRVYVGRSGDTVKSISEKIYGDVGRQKDLRKWNSFLSRGVKVGDKIYYQSPSNPADMSMLTYYEDVSIPAQHYLSRDGDNIRTISKTLLGHKDSWKEVWVTNPDVESKGDIPAGLNLRYWPAEASGTAPILAQQQDPMAGQQPAMDPQNQAGLGQANIPAEPIGQPSIDPLAQGVQPPSADGPETKPTPAADPLALGSTESEPPAPPAPPEDTASGQTGKTANNTPPVSSESASAEADQMMTIGLVVIALIAAGAVVMLVKRNRSRKIDLTQTTQVG